MIKYTALSKLKGIEPHQYQEMTNQRKMISNIRIYQRPEDVDINTYLIYVENRRQLIPLFECQSEEDVKTFLNLMQRMK